MIYENLLFWFTLAAAVMYFLSGLLFLFQQNKLSYLFALLGWCSNLGIVIVHWAVNSYPPFANMYQILAVLSLIFPLVAVAFLKCKKELSFTFAYFVLTAVVPLVGTMFMDNEIQWTLVPALRSVWFVPHVFSYMISYTLAAIAFLMTIRFFVFQKQAEQSFDAVVTITRISVPFMVNGLVLGAIWADQIWGNFWQWDVKEVWSLITCLLYLAGLHLSSSKHKRPATVIFMVGVVALIITFLFVNIFPGASGSQHTYA